MVWLSWVECHPLSQNVVGSIPGQYTCTVEGLKEHPSIKADVNMCFSGDWGKQCGYGDGENYVCKRLCKNQDEYKRRGTGTDCWDSWEGGSNTRLLCSTLL